MEAETQAFGGPGVAPTWSSSDKDFVTTALGGSRLWATVGHGIINEVYWPSTGQPQIRDFGFYLVGDKRWVDLKRVRNYRLSTPGPFLMAPTIIHDGEDYELTLDILPAPQRDVLLVRYALRGPYRLVVIVAPHLSSTGVNNDAWIEDDSAYARHRGASLCLCARPALTNLSCGYVGSSDGWQDLNRHGHLAWNYRAAPNGTVALTGETSASSGVLALGFSSSPRGAHTRCLTGLAASFDVLRDEFLNDWNDWGKRLQLPRPDEALGDEGLLSAAVLKTHEDRAYPGAVVASLSVPWGNSTDTLGGYHLVWPRDATLTAFALLAANQVMDARHILSHLAATQQRDGRWPQNYFPSGEPFWVGVQLDEAAFPILLAAKLREMGEAEIPNTRDMVRAAVGFIANSGPCSPQDRWEENPGVSPFTLAVAVAALVAAAPWLADDERDYAWRLADDWNERLEGWCYVSDTELARQHGVRGYYVRLGTPDKNGLLTDTLQLRNRNGEDIRASALVSMDFSYLVRLGLRRALDPRVQDTIKVVDSMLKVETPAGALYHRYNEDGYGEHADGSAFDGSGIGRAWPLLVGERGHLAMQSGEDPLPYLHTMLRCSSAGGLLPEQVWDSAAIPEAGLEPGRPSGSAMPLLWSHAEFLKLLIAREHRRPIELLQSVEERFAAPNNAVAWHWRNEVRVLRLESGRGLSIEDRSPFVLHYGFDGWQQVTERAATAQPFGLWSVSFTPLELAKFSAINFTRRYDGRWEGEDHQVTLGHEDVEHTLRPS
ncbi:MAG TPA: glycoside hydrolase family 15 protein [Steroidobacteraceae bacterium]|jgi:glucoamylase|nr:glycoside hydrolase family 15 protein [Steroidobacteraceae bacterium]